MTTPTPAGEFKSRVQVLNPVAGEPNEIGEATRAEAVVATLWAKVTPATAAVVTANAANAMNVSHEVRLRYTTLVTQATVLLLGTRRLDVVDLVDVEEARRELKLMCNERRAA